MQAISTITGPVRIAWTLLALTLLLPVVAPLDGLANQMPARVIVLTIRNGQVSADHLSNSAHVAPTLFLTQGDHVEIIWQVDAAMEMHLHGYKIELRAVPGVPVKMPFLAYASGRFPIEIHSESGRHRTILYIEVHPK